MAKKVDTNSPEHKRQLAKILAAVFVVSVIGGLLLAQKINVAEAAYEERHGQSNVEKVDAPTDAKAVQKK